MRTLPLHLCGAFISITTKPEDVPRVGGTTRLLRLGRLGRPLRIQRAVARKYAVARAAGRLQKTFLSAAAMEEPCTSMT